MFWVSEESGIGAQLESFREVRRSIEASVLPLATSVDGRWFSFQASLHGLGDLWRRRQERSPILIVIDEAHNVCPAEPPSQLVRMAAEHAVRIAAEGRKFGLYLLVSTQRPQKIPENVLSQADNLVLLRLNSLADAAFAEAAFSFVPPSLIERSVTFRQGEGLIAGKISPQPALLRFGARITQEGGADVPATWAAPAD